MTNLEKPGFGFAYNFTLIEALEDTTEYLIDMEDLKNICKQNSLSIHKEFPNLEDLLNDDMITKESK